MANAQTKKLVRWVLDHTSDGFYVRLMHYLYFPLLRRRWPGILHIRRPRNWNEKIQYLGINIERLIPDAHIYTDKLAVRDYVANAIGQEHLIPLLGSWDRAEQVDWSALPDQFVIKANHGSGFNIIVDDKAQLDTAAASKQLNRWLATDYSQFCRENNYRHIPPKLLAEQLLGEKDKAPIEYKFFCFDGRTELVLVVVDRDTDVRWLFLDREWNRLPVRKEVPPPDREIAQPIVFDEMIRVAERLALPFFFVRVDLYEIDGLVYFGELTFTPSGGTSSPFRPAEWNRKLGDLINLPR